MGQHAADEPGPSPERTSARARVQVAAALIVASVFVGLFLPLWEHRPVGAVLLLAGLGAFAGTGIAKRRAQRASFVVLAVALGVIGGVAGHDALLALPAPGLALAAALMLNERPKPPRA